MSNFRTLTISRRQRITIITLARPEMLNRFDDDLHVELTDALAELSSDSETLCVVLASTGKVFSAGGSTDLIRCAHSSLQERLRIIEDARKLLFTLLEVRQPIVAAMQGAAVGLGATVVLACDAVVACRSAHIADPHVRMGVVAGDGGCVVWPQAAGMMIAKRFLLTGDRMMAEDALRAGLITDLVEEPSDVLPGVCALADRIAALPPLAVQLTKRALNRVVLQRAGEAFELSLAYELATMGTDDAIEAVDAFETKRQGRFAGY